MTTVSAVRQAVEETRKLRLADLGKPTDGDPLAVQHDLKALERIMASPALLTTLANRLSDRGEAGNKAALANVEELREAMLASESLSIALAREGKDEQADRVRKRQLAIEWAIDQLTPPELAKRPDPCAVCGSVNHQADWHSS